MPTSVVPQHFRDYQDRLINQLLNDAKFGRECAVEWPTGSGKTLVMCAFALRALGLGYYDKIIIATTQNHIRATFVNESRKFFLTDPRMSGVMSAEIDLSYLLSSMENERVASSAPEIVDYLHRESNQEGARVCSHMALVSDNMSLEGLDLSKCLLILDEGHHSGEDETKLGQFVSKWRELGGKYFFFSASPYRNDQGKVVLEGMKHYFRSIHQHQEEGHAPRKVHTAIFSKECSTNSNVKVRAKIIADAMRQKWENIGRPPMFVKLPAAEHEGDRTIINQFIEAFATTDDGQHINVFDATGIKAKESFQQILERENSCNFSERINPVDIIIGVSRVSEGTDWVHCSAVFIYKLISSAPAIVQLNGRAMRKKKEGDHPFWDDAHIYNFVDINEGESILAQTSHSNIQMILCAQNEYGSSISFPALSAFTSGRRKAVEQADLSTIDDLEEIEVDYSDDMERATEESNFARTCLAIVQEEGGTSNVLDLIERAVELGAEREEVEHLVRQILVAQDEELREQVEDYGEELQGRKMRMGAGAVSDPHLRDILEELLPDFCARTLVKHDGLADFYSQFHSLSGQTPREFAKTLYDRVYGDITFKNAQECVKWKNNHGEKWPTRGSQTLEENRLGIARENLKSRYLKNIHLSPQCRQFIDENNFFPDTTDLNLKKAQECLEWTKLNGRRPQYQSSKDIYEKRLSTSLNSLKERYNKNNLSPLSSECRQFISKNYDIFFIKKDISLENAQLCVEWRNIYGRWPRGLRRQDVISSTDKKEKKLGNAFSSLKQHYKRNVCLSSECRFFMEQNNMLSS